MLAGWQEGENIFPACRQSGQTGLILLTNIKMPDKDGWEVLKELKKLTLRLK